MGVLEDLVQKVEEIHSMLLTLTERNGPSPAVQEPLFPPPPRSRRPDGMISVPEVTRFVKCGDTKARELIKASMNGRRRPGFREVLTTQEDFNLWWESVEGRTTVAKYHNLAEV